MGDNMKGWTITARPVDWSIARAILGPFDEPAVNDDFTVAPCETCGIDCYSDTATKVIRTAGAAFICIRCIKHGA